MNRAFALPPQPGMATRSATERCLRALCVVLAVAIWLPGLTLLSGIWSGSDFLGHGYLVPAVAALLLYTRRDDISRAYREAPAPALGWVVVLAAAGFEVLAIASGVVTATGAGIAGVLLATAYGLGGLRLLRATWVPFAFLLLMVPPPGFVLDHVLVYLKLFVTDLSVSALQAGGLTVAADGNQILVPGHTLFVADACTGLVSIVTLLPLAVVVALFLSHGVWRRAVVIASVVPLAVGANAARVIVTVWLVANGSPEYGEGLLHEGFGLTTYIGGTVALLGVARLVR